MFREDDSVPRDVIEINVVTSIVSPLHPPPFKPIGEV